MAAANLPSAGVGDLVPVRIQHPKQLTASNSAAGNKVPCGVKGRVVGICGIGGVIGYGSTPTDFDITVYKGASTALHATAIPIIDSSTRATEGAAALKPTLSTTDATVKVEETDYLWCEYTLTGGSTITLDGPGAVVLIARE